MVVGESRSGENLVLPVGERIVVGIDTVVLAVAGDVVVGIDRLLAVVERRFATEDHVLLGADRFGRVGGRLPADVTAVGDRRLPLLAALGRHEDDAVGRTRTVDGRRGGVLQHRNLVDLRGVDGIEAALHPVDEHQRRGARTAEGSDTAHADHAAVAARSSALRGNGHAGGDALESGRRGYDGTVGEVFGRDRRDGTGQIDLFLRVVADDHDFVDE